MCGLPFLQRKNPPSKIRIDLGRTGKLPDSCFVSRACLFCKPSPRPDGPCRLGQLHGLGSGPRSQPRAARRLEAGAPRGRETTGQRPPGFRRRRGDRLAAGRRHTGAQGGARSHGVQGKFLYHAFHATFLSGKLWRFPVYSGMSPLANKIRLESNASTRWTSLRKAAVTKA